MAEADDGSGEAWTDEKHTSFLNWLEASFVSWMLFGGGRCAYPEGAGHGPTPPPLPLDRYLPDGADTTLDCRTGRRGRQKKARKCPSGFTEGLRRTRKRLQRRCTAPRVQDDQVVPGLEGMAGGEDVWALSVPEVVQPAAMEDQQPDGIREQ